MISGHFVCKKIKIIAWGFLFITTTIFAAPSIQYVSPMGEENWRMTGNPLRCGLSLTIPNYGIGYFEQYATQPPHFILRKWDQVQRALPAQVIATPPVWKPLLKGSYLVARTFIKPGEYGLFLNRQPALKLLTFLSQGYQANFNYLSEEGFRMTVTLSPIRFQKVYSQYQRCLGRLLSFNYDDVKENVFHFGVDSKLLSDADKAQLRRIAQYVDADIQIDVIKIIGHADDSGRKGYNNAISQYRAEAVKNYLIWLGVPQRKLSITWVGALQPIARNDTDEGRAANRRVVVTLIKK
ncbi:TPA: OmpA family protein [Legionella pneumophila]|nr:OmpA family protein [Legionella pneumophila]HAT8181752.1 OmpA family protein [Legionella pneumophila]